MFFYFGGLDFCSPLRYLCRGLVKIFIISSNYL